MLFICYPKCTTCQKAKNFLDGRNISYELRDIKLQNPTRAEIEKWHKLSGLPLKKLFNTSGLLYKQMQLSGRLSSMSEQEQYELLASDGMLVKRPILIADGKGLFGFKQQDWEKIIV